MDGSATLAINRAGKGSKIDLAKLYHKANGGASGAARQTWDLSIPTTTKSLVTGTILQQPIGLVRSDGLHPVVRLTLTSGKTIKLRPDREVFTSASTTVKVSSLSTGDDIISNGIAACARCRQVARLIDPGRTWAGYCPTCYQQLRPTSNKKMSFVDKSGYIQVLRMQFHPNAAHSGGYSKGKGRFTVAEHRLVMEASLNGMPYQEWRDLCIHNKTTSSHSFLPNDIIVHHINGIPSDNRLSNLTSMTTSQHATQHGVAGWFKNLNGGRTRHGGCAVFLPVADKVASVVPDGVANVYDVVMLQSGQPFIGNGIIVKSL
jgi:HNH endonuclease